MNKKKNGTVEVLRFLFCIAILLHHISLDVYGRNYTENSWGGVLRYGAMGVEFFFMTSGYFMAKSIGKLSSDPFNFAEAGIFIWRKLKPILPYHIIVNGMMLAAVILFSNPSIEEVIGKASSFLFLPVLGFHNHSWMLGAEWYIGYMLFAMLIIYPVMRRWPDFVVHYIAPIAGVLIYGYLSSQYGRVMETDRMLRAFGGLLLGIAAFGIGEYLKIAENGSKKGIFIKIYPFTIITTYILYMNSSLSRQIQPLLVILLWSALIITFAGQGLFSGSQILNNRLAYWLGTVSLPVYMVQNFTREVGKTVFKNQSSLTLFLCELVLTLTGGFALHYGLKLIRSKYSGNVNNG